MWNVPFHFLHNTRYRLFRVLGTILRLTTNDISETARYCLYSFATFRFLTFIRPQPLPRVEYSCINYENLSRRDIFTRFSLFWNFTPRRLVVTQVPGTPIGPIFKGQADLALEVRQVAPKRRQLTTNLCFVNSEKKDDLIYTSAEA
jgi:hypothetical protein